MHPDSLFLGLAALFEFSCSSNKIIGLTIVSAIICEAIGSTILEAIGSTICKTISSIIFQVIGLIIFQAIGFFSQSHCSTNYRYRGGLGILSYGPCTNTITMQ
jgi:hypothetical protein